MLCHVGEVFDRFDDRQEAHVEAFLLAQRYRLAAEMVERHTETEVRWTDVRRHAYRRCSCWSNSSSLPLIPSRSKKESLLNETAKHIYQQVFADSSTDQSIIDEAMDELSSVRYVDWNPPVACYSGGRQWIFRCFISKRI